MFAGIPKSRCATWMIMLLFILILSLTACSEGANPAVAPGDDPGEDPGDDPGTDSGNHLEDKQTYTIAELAELASKALAYIEAPSAINPGWYSVGSGFVIDAGGIIVTNYHVMEGADSATIEIEGRLYTDVKVIAASEEWDLAILKVAAQGLTALPLGEGIEYVKLGEEVVALGNPQGLKGTISDGIVSSLRHDTEFNIALIQTTAPVSKGSSGGPLLNMRGEVIGVNTLSYLEGQNLNFAVPVDLVKQLLEEARGGPEYTVAEIFGGDSPARSSYAAQQGELAVILRWQGSADLDLGIWSEDFEFLGSAAILGGCPDITFGGQGEEWFVFQKHGETDFSLEYDLPRNFTRGRYIVAPLYYGPEEGSARAELIVCYPNGEQLVMHQPFLEYDPPYDLWFALLVDAEQNRCKILDFFYEGVLAILLEWDTPADLDLCITNYNYEGETFVPSAVLSTPVGNNITDGREGLEVYRCGVFGDYDFTSGLMDVNVRISDLKGEPTTRATVTLLFPDFSLQRFWYNFTPDPLGDYWWQVLKMLDPETMLYEIPEAERYYPDLGWEG